MRFVFLASFCLLVMAMPARADGPLFGAEILKLLPGHFHVVAGATTIEVDIAKGGRISGVQNNGSKDNGRWRMAGNKVCVKFSKWLDRVEHCEALSMAGSEIKGSVFSAWKR